MHGGNIRSGWACLFRWRMPLYIVQLLSSQPFTASTTQKFLKRISIASRYFHLTIDRRYVWKRPGLPAVQNIEGREIYLGLSWLRVMPTHNRELIACNNSFSFLPSSTHVALSLQFFHWNHWLNQQLSQNLGHRGSSHILQDLRVSSAVDLLFSPLSHPVQSFPPPQYWRSPVVAPQMTPG